jgi:hypothetical protein
MKNILPEQRLKLAEAFAGHPLFRIEEATNEEGVLFDLYKWGQDEVIGAIIPAEYRWTLIVNPSGDDAFGSSDIFRTPQEIVRRLMRVYVGKTAHSGEAAVSL